MPVRRKKSLPPRKKARKKSLPPRKIARKKYRSDSSSDSSSDRDDGSAALLARIERRMSASPIKHAPSKRRASSVKKSVKKRKVRKSVASDSSTDSDSSNNWMVILFILLHVILRRWTLSILYKINEPCGCKGNLTDVQLKSRSKFVADSCSDTCTRASRYESELKVSYLYNINELCGCKGNLTDVQLKSRSKFVADSCSDTCTRASRYESEIMVSFVFLIYLVFKIKNQQEINQKYVQIYFVLLNLFLVSDTTTQKTKNHT